VTGVAVPPAHAGILAFLKRHLLGLHAFHSHNQKVVYSHRLSRRCIAHGQDPIYQAENNPAAFQPNTPPNTPMENNDQAFSTRASWYGPGFQGRRTASGQRFNQYGLTAASRTLPLGSQVLVSNPTTGKCCTVTINDRGPYVNGRDIDLSRGAAAKIGVTGVSPVVCVAYASSASARRGAPVKIKSHVMHLMAGIS
jgi:rare lipoprotein A